ncbi:hypothetical protein Bbelb_072680 [Branchiostoma belcheri]|nr:hypothetical protein Bbelb_072680 [Branchiostoma belcheri]
MEHVFHCGLPDFTLHVLFTSLKLGIFDLLDASADPMTAVSISEGIGSDTDATKRLLDACTGLGFLRKLNADNETEDGKYQLTEASRMFLTTSSPTNLADWVGHLASLYGSPWADLPRAIREGPAFSTRRGLERGKTFKDIYSTTKGFMGAMEGLPTVFGAKTASAFNLTEFQNICDIGGCTGPLAYHLAAAYPKASISVFDLPEVVKVAVARGPDDEQGQRVSFLPDDCLLFNLCPVCGLTIKAGSPVGWGDSLRQRQLARRLQRRLSQPIVSRAASSHVTRPISTARRSSWHHCGRPHITGDFFHDPLPPADLYVVCRILHDWTEDKVLTILTKIHDSLPPGGGLLVVEHMLGDDKTGPEVAHKYDLLMMLCTGGRQRSGREFQRLLSSVGFQEKAYRTLPMAAPDIPAFGRVSVIVTLPNVPRRGEARDRNKNGAKTEHQAANGKCAVLPMDLSTTLAEGNASLNCAPFRPADKPLSEASS